MKKSILGCLWYCLIQLAFSASAIAGQAPVTAQPQPPSAYIKLDGSGQPLPDSAPTWAMVSDLVTGRIWEAKRNKDGVSHEGDPHDADNTYTWYDSNPDTNGGNAGTPGNGMNTEAFVNAINRERFGGYSDWRLPTIKELVHLADALVTTPSIKTRYFPDTVFSWHWSSSTSANYPLEAWGVGFRNGRDSYSHKHLHGYVRAVRVGRQDVQMPHRMGYGMVSHFPP